LFEQWAQTEAMHALALASRRQMCIERCVGNDPVKRYRPSQDRMAPKTEDTSMHRPDSNARSRSEAVGRDTLLTLCVALPIATLVFIILHI